MKTIIISLILGLTVCTACAQSTTQWSCIDPGDADKALGQAAKRTEIISLNTNGVMQYKCTYRALSPDQKTGNTGMLYYMAEVYPTTDAARQSFASIVTGNKNHDGFALLNNIGDEALLHTDGTGFQLIMVRKGKRMIRLKVNKITSYTAPVETLQGIARKITALL